jgi:hypothetical protein
MFSNYVDVNKLKTMDEFYTYTQPYGSLARAFGNRVYGIDHNRSGSVVPPSRNKVEYVFFTRPQLNMTDKNISNNPALHNLLSKKDTSSANFVKTTLDPRLGFYDKSTISPIVDNQNIFIPIMTNDCISLSGWPDRTAPVYTSPEGIRGEQWSVVDGTIEINNKYDLTANFDNIIGDDLVSLISTWLTAQSAVQENVMSKYPREIARGVMDYHTRVYVLTLDETRTFVRMFACCGAGIITNDTIGSFFDYNRNDPQLSGSDTFGVRISCVGAYYNDFQYIMAFNDSVCIGKPEMYDVTEGIPSTMRKLPNQLSDGMNYRSYPLINEETLELEWWVDSNSPSFKHMYSILTDDGKRLMDKAKTCWSNKRDQKL